MNIKRQIYLVILLIGFIATGILLFNRMNTESQAKEAEIILDYDEFVLLGEQEGLSPQDVFSAFVGTGVESVAIKEDTLYALVDEGNPIAYSLYKNLTKDINWQTQFSGDALNYLVNNTSEYDVVVSTYDEALYNRISDAITARYDTGFYHFFSDDPLKVIVLEGEREDLYYVEYGKVNDIYGKGVKTPRTEVASAIEDIGLGFDPEKIEAVKLAGLGYNLRPSNFYKFNSHIVKAYFDDVDAYGATINEIVFNGREVLGYELETGMYQQDLYDILKERDLPIALIESGVQRGYSEQKGIEQISKDLDYEVVRVFPVVEYIQQRYNYLGYYEGAIEVENTLYRAITERNIRSVYFRPFKKSNFTYYDSIDEYKDMFIELGNRLEAHNIVLGASSTMPNNAISPFLLILSGYGLLILGLIILKLVFEIGDKFEWGLLGLGLLGVTGVNFAAPNLSIELFAFLAAIIYPTLAIIFLIEYIKDILGSHKVFSFKDILKKTLVALIVSILICLVGGLTVGAIMSRSDYLVEMSFYRGVKASLILPVLIFVVIYLIKLGYKRSENDSEENIMIFDDIKRFLNEDFKMYYVILAGIVGFIGFIYIARSGHETNVEALNIEIIFRNFLENVLIARPRTKEILIAFPALSAAIYLATRGYKKWLFPFTLTAVIGLTSVVNTFCHARTPIYLSVYRTLISLGISIIMGIIVIVLLDIINRIYIAFSGSKTYE